jgi:plastocyanin
MNHAIVIEDHAYNPDSITISAGDTITWENRDTVRHTATRTDEPAFDTELISTSAISAPIEFSTPTDATGINYFCIPHPFMRGTIIVESPSAKPQACG